ncbi:MAG: NAD(P)H-dependent glycerol-3-phosphate dehydrogenase [Betaproteobacteria bacterium]
MKIAIFGAGAWGTALAQHAARRHAVLLWARDAAQAADMRRERANQRYLPGVVFEPGLEVASDLHAACQWLSDQPSLAIIATPVAGLAPTLDALVTSLPATCAGLVWLCKGLEPSTLQLPHQLAASRLGQVAGAVLAGPSFAQEVAAGLPVALTVAGGGARLGEQVVAALHHGAARIYATDDVIGVELGGALKNVMAIAAGIADGLELGMNARAALITRGLAEMTRLGVALGARAETFMGLTGLGDLVLTCTGGLSRNRRVGLALARGEPLAQIISGLGHVAEGVSTAPVARNLAARLAVDMPILQAVCAVLEGHTRATDAVLALLSREPRREGI